MTLKQLFVALVVWSALTSCARYGVKNDSARQYPTAQIVVSQSREEAVQTLQSFLRKRGFRPRIERLRLPDTTDLELDWVRDSSLEYFYILSGKRTPHLSHWKAVWRVTQLGPRRSRLQVETMELLYLGPQDSAGPTPTLDGQWVEAPDTHLRGWLELRRYFVETFPRQTLPPELASIAIPSLQSPPLSLQDFRPVKRHRSARPSSF